MWRYPITPPSEEGASFETVFGIGSEVYESMREPSA
jgi:hypothetical protein